MDISTLPWVTAASGWAFFFFAHMALGWGWLMSFFVSMPVGLLIGIGIYLAMGGSMSDITAAA